LKLKKKIGFSNYNILTLTFAVLETFASQPACIKRLAILARVSSLSTAGLRHTSCNAVLPSFYQFRISNNLLYKI